MTARELSQFIGQTVYFTAGQLRFTCRILDAKIGFGQPRFLITPTAGSGERWVEFSSITPMQVQAPQVNRASAPVARPQALPQPQWYAPAPRQENRVEKTFNSVVKLLDFTR